MINFSLNRALCIATNGCLYLEGHFSGPVNHSFFIFFFILICTQERGGSTNLKAQGHIFKLSIFVITFFFFRNKYNLLLKKTTQENPLRKKQLREKCLVEHPPSRLIKEKTT